MTEEEEVIMAWSTQVNGNDDLGGPGLALSFVSQLRSLLIQVVSQSFNHDQHLDVGFPALAGALESLVSATQRLKKKRRPYDRNLDSSEDESAFISVVFLIPISFGWAQYIESHPLLSEIFAGFNS